MATRRASGWEGKEASAILQSFHVQWFTSLRKLPASRFMDVPGGFGYGFIDCEETKLRFTRAFQLQEIQEQRPSFVTSSGLAA